jgi:hypothetical protein
MYGKKNPLTFFREADEARMQQFKTGGMIPGPGDKIPQKAIDKANKFNDIKDSSAGKKSARALDKLNKVKSKYPDWNQQVTFANGTYKLK